jgi:hypothetical protein
MPFASADSGKQNTLDGDSSDMSVYAEFHRIGNDSFRFDTRIYLNGAPKSQAGGVCIAAVIGKNPGSAGPTNGSGWKAVSLNGDKTLPFIRNRFLDAYDQAGKLPPKLSYVQILNLSYFCDKSLRRALKAAAFFNNPQRCPAERRNYDIVWFVWGGSHRSKHSIVTM